MRTAPTLSVVICTYNRSSLLRRVLESLAAQQGTRDFEVVVVDNHSSDETQQVIQEWASADHFPFTAAFEPTQGHYARARNVGWQKASGEIVAFVDDDVRVPPEWTSRLLKVFREIPGVDGVGGPVVPDWEMPPPEWVTPELFVCIGVGDYGNKGRFLTGKEFPIGANMAFRTEMLRSVGGFDPRFGRIGKESIYNDEVELVERLRRQGASIYYDPGLEVFHLVSTSRTNKKYFLNRRSIDGRSIALVESLHHGKLFLMRNVVLRSALAIVRDGTAFLATFLIRRNNHFVYSCRLAKTRKYITTALGILAGQFSFQKDS